MYRFLHNIEDIVLNAFQPRPTLLVAASSLPRHHLYCHPSSKNYPLSLTHSGGHLCWVLFFISSTAANPAFELARHPVSHSLDISTTCMNPFLTSLTQKTVNIFYRIHHMDQLSPLLPSLFKLHTPESLFCQDSPSILSLRKLTSNG